MTVASFEHRRRRLEAAGAIGDELERVLLTDRELGIAPNKTINAGSDPTWLVVLASGHEGVFKRVGPNAASAAAGYQQDPVEANLHEVVAWRLARALGPPWDALVPVAVPRTVITVGYGVLIERRPGVAQGASRRETPAQFDAAALWDALIGHQDRHGRNYRYDAVARRLSLIDHAFAFARPGDHCNRSYFLGHRWYHQAGGLWDSERDALERVLSTDLFGVDAYLPKDRADALTARAELMLSTDHLLRVGEF